MKSDLDLKLNLLCSVVRRAGKRDYIFVGSNRFEIAISQSAISAKLIGAQADIRKIKKIIARLPGVYRPKEPVTFDACVIDDNCVISCKWLYSDQE